MTTTEPQPETRATPFADAPAELRPALERRGFTQLTSVQEAVLATGATDRDLQISSQTGSGKTIALGLVMAPDVISRAAGGGRRGPDVLIIAPTRELAVQLQEELGWLYADIPGVASVCVTGGTSVGFERRRLAAGPRIVVGTPGRLLHHIEAGALDCSGVSQLVLDEADQMLDMGFRDELDGILATVPNERRTHLVSATFPPEVRKLSKRYQSEPQHIEGTRLGAAHEDIAHIVYPVEMRDRYAALVNLLLMANGERTLVFVQTRASAISLAEKLQADGFAAAPLSGDLQQTQRVQTLNAFRVGSITTLVATDVAARGLHITDVEAVIHADPPLGSDLYTHRSGRTGRAGRKGRSLLLAPVRAERRIRYMLSDANIQASWQTVPSASEVKKHVRKRARRQLHAELGAAAPRPDGELEYARKLMENYDAAQVIATLLAGRDAELPREPFEVQAPAPSPRHDRPRNERPRHDRPRHDRSRNDRPRDDRQQGRNGPRPNGARAPQHGYTSFRVNWGSRSGANPRRVLAMVCRRGGITGRQVGAIRIDFQAATFDVEDSVAREFESRAKERCSRQPWMEIQRNDGRSARSE